MFQTYKNMSFARIFKLVAFAMIMASSPVFAADKTIMVLGDSLVAGYGLPLDQSFPAQLEKKLRAEGKQVRVINAGVSGETSAGLLSRLDWALSEKPDYAIIVTGGNDMLRAVDPKVTRKNLKDILEIMKTRKIPVLLAGMRSYKNLGEIFGGQYQEMYETLAEEYGAVHYEFFLEGVAINAELNQQDGLHPNEKGVAVIVDKMLDDVEELLEDK